MRSNVRSYYKPKQKDAFFDVEGVVNKDTLLFRNQFHDYIRLQTDILLYRNSCTVVNQVYTVQQSYMLMVTFRLFLLIVPQEYTGWPRSYRKYIHCKSRNLPNTDTQHYSTYLR